MIPEEFAVNNRLSHIPSRFQGFCIERENIIAGKIVDLTLDDLSPGNVVIRTCYAGVNYKDALAAAPDGKVISHFPRIGGSDLAGVVLASYDPRFKVSDRVFAYAHGLGVHYDGGFSEVARVRGDCLLHIPDGLSLFEAAALGVAGFTAALAVHLLEEFGLKPSAGNVLINGATGGVASMAIDIMSAIGYSVSAMTSKLNETEQLLTLGAAEVLDSSVAAQPERPLSTASWAAAIDSVGGSQLAWLISTLRPRGAIACVGNAGGNSLLTDVLPFILRGVRLIGINASSYVDIESQLWTWLAGPCKPRRALSTVRTIQLESLSHHLAQMRARTISGRTVVFLGEE